MIRLQAKENVMFNEITIGSKTESQLRFIKGSSERALYVARHTVTIDGPKDITFTIRPDNLPGVGWVVIRGGGLKASNKLGQTKKYYRFREDAVESAYKQIKIISTQVSSFQKTERLQ